MTKGKKAVLCVAAACILIGAGLIFAALKAVDFDEKQLHTTQVSEDSFVVSESFSCIATDMASANVSIVLSDDSVCKAECLVRDGIRFDWEIRDQTLAIRQIDERTFWQTIGWIGESPKLTLYLPAGEYETVSAHSTSGDIVLGHGLRCAAVAVETQSGDVVCYAHAQSLTATSSSGDLQMIGCSVQDMTVETSSGICKLFDVAATQTLCLQSGSGNIWLTDCDAATLDVQTQSGDVTGTLRTGKTYRVQTASGDVSVPPDQDGGVCSVRTKSGDIRFS